jgi:glycosyltransferase involved in cell wall biosynthesis
MRQIYDFEYLTDCGDLIKLLILVNDLKFFLSHRSPIAKAAMEAGYDVSVAYGDLGGIKPEMVEQLDFHTYFVPIKRGGTNICQELGSLYAIWQLFRNIRPDILHLVTIKPYLYGGILAKLMNIHGVVSAVAGLGSVFIQTDWRSRSLRALLYPLFRLAFSHSNQYVIVQNEEDARVLVNWGVLDSHKIRLLPGSGVDLKAFKDLEEPFGVPTICFASRLLRDKGLIEFIESAALLRQRGILARFWLAGDTDKNNPSGLTEHELRVLNDKCVVEILGYQNDIPNLYSHCHVICLPSYREGLPKALVEAAAASRAVVTTDVPGCRDAIIPNITGLLVPVKSSEKLADAIQWLIHHPAERLEMGRAGRNLAEREFNIDKIVQRHMDIYNESRNRCLN